MVSRQNSNRKQHTSLGVQPTKRKTSSASFAMVSATLVIAAAAVLMSPTTSTPFSGPSFASATRGGAASSLPPSPSPSVKEKLEAILREHETAMEHGLQSETVLRDDYAALRLRKAKATSEAENAINKINIIDNTAPTASSPATASSSSSSSSSHVIVDATPMHIVFGSIPCYGHWNPLRSIAKAVFRRGHHVSLLMEESKLEHWCEDTRSTLIAERDAALLRKEKLKMKLGIDVGSGGDVQKSSTAVNTFNCIPMPDSKAFERNFFINISRSDDIPSSFERLFEEMFRFTNITQDNYSRALYVIRELTTGVAGAGGGERDDGDNNNSNTNNKNENSTPSSTAPTPTTRTLCTDEALRRAASIGFSPELSHLLCGGSVPPISLLMTDSGTFPTYAAASQFGIPTAALFPLSVSLPSGQASYMPMLGSGKPSLQHKSFGERLGTYVKRNVMMLATKFIAISQLFDKLRAEANGRQQRQHVIGFEKGEKKVVASTTETSETTATRKNKNKDDDDNRIAVPFPNLPLIPPMQFDGERDPSAGPAAASMMNSIIFTPGIWGYDIAQPLCPNIIAIGSTAVDDDVHPEDLEEDADEEDRKVAAHKPQDAFRKKKNPERHLVRDRRIREFGFSPSPAAFSAEDSTASTSATVASTEEGTAVQRRRSMLEDDLTIFLDESPACVHYGAVYVNFGTLTILSDETFNRTLSALLRVPFCVVWKVTEAARFDHIKQLLLSTEIPSDLKQFAADQISSSSSSSSSNMGNVGGSEGALPDTGVNPRGRFFIKKHFEAPEAILEHPNTRVFISHCGDTSVLESIHALTPVAGIPIFADQPDVCQRIDESGIGSYIGAKSTFEPERLVEKLIELGLPSTSSASASSPSPYHFNNRDYKGNRQHYLERLYAVRRMSLSLGGPTRAAQILEEHYSKGLFNVARSMVEQFVVEPEVKASIRLSTLDDEKDKTALTGEAAAAPSPFFSSPHLLHPHFSHPHACAVNRFPVLDRQVMRALYASAKEKKNRNRNGSNKDDDAMTIPIAFVDDAPPLIPINSLTAQYQYDVFWLVFTLVGVVMVASLMVIKKVLLCLCCNKKSGSCSEKKAAKATSGSSSSTTSAVVASSSLAGRKKDADASTNGDDDDDDAEKAAQQQPIKNNKRPRIRATTIE